MLSMTSARTALAAAALAAAALTPATALAGGPVAKPDLGGSPQMRIIDSHHARLQFTSDTLPRTATGFDAGISFAGSARRVTKIQLHGTHGSDKVYYATVASKTALVDHASYAVTFRLGDSTPVRRSVKLYQVGDHT